tara:strand:+ start:34 stop:501 length:468 start_codon:yes stop_codon:yes gene_type:complete
MSYITKSLSNDEEILIKFKPHWAIWIGFIVYTLIALIFIIATLTNENYPAIMSLILTTLVFIPFLKILFSILGLEQGLTNLRVIKKLGLIGRKTDEMRLSQVETTEVSESVLGRIFGYGKIKISGVGISDVVLLYIPDPIEMKKKIDNALFNKYE